MLKTIVRLAAALLLVPGAAAAEPIKLKLSFFSSDRSIAYEAAIKPFVEAVNADAKGLIEIEPHVAGSLSRDLTANFVRELGCDEVQGFLFARPIPAAALSAAMLKKAKTQADRAKGPRLAAKNGRAVRIAV